MNLTACQSPSPVETKAPPLPTTPEVDGDYTLSPRYHTLNVAVMHEPQGGMRLYWQDDDPNDNFTPFPMEIYRSSDIGCNVAFIDQCADGVKFTVYSAAELPLTDTASVTRDTPFYYWFSQPGTNMLQMLAVEATPPTGGEGRVVRTDGVLLPASVGVSDYPSYRIGIDQPPEAFLNKLWIIGGTPLNGARGPRNDVWSSDDGVVWKQVLPHDPQATDRFSPRSFYQLVVFQDRLWLFGGQYAAPDAAPADAKYYYNDAWSTADGVHWRQEVEQIDVYDPIGLEEAQRLPIRKYSEILYFKGKLFSYGGLTPTQSPESHEGVDDIWSSTDGKKWYRETPLGQGAGYPRYDRPSYVVFNDYVWRLGGLSFFNSDENENSIPSSNAVWRSDDGVQWHQILADNDDGAEEGAITGQVGGRFSPRGAMGAAVFNGRLWVVGGETYQSFVSRKPNDVWSSADGINWRREVDRDGYHTKYLSQNRCEEENFDGFATDNDGRILAGQACPVKDPQTLGIPYSYGGLSDHHLVVKDNKLWMIGGIREEDTTNALHLTRNIVMYSDNGKQWHRAQRGMPIDDMNGLVFFRLRNRMYLYGSTPFGEAVQPRQPILLSSLDGLSWRQEATPPLRDTSDNNPETMFAEGMLVRYHPTVLQDPDHNWVMIIGGLIRDQQQQAGYLGRSQADAWLFDGVSWEHIRRYELPPFADFRQRGGGDDLYYYHNTNTLQTPFFQRYGATAVWYRKHNASGSPLVAGIFGGANENQPQSLADFWEVATAGSRPDANWQLRVATDHARDIAGINYVTKPGLPLPFDRMMTRQLAAMVALPRPQIFNHQGLATANSQDIVWVIGGRTFAKLEVEHADSEKMIRYLNDLWYFDPTLQEEYNNIIFSFYDDGKNIQKLYDYGFIRVKEADEPSVTEQSLSKNGDYPARAMYQAVVKEDRYGELRAFIFGGMSQQYQQQGRHPLYFTELGNELWSFNGQPASDAPLQVDSDYYSLTEASWRWRKEKTGLFGDENDAGQLGFGTIMLNGRYWYLTDDDAKRLWVSDDLYDWGWVDYLQLKVITHVDKKALPNAQQ